MEHGRRSDGGTCRLHPDHNTAVCTARDTIAPTLPYSKRVTPAGMSPSAGENAKLPQMRA